MSSHFQAIQNPNDEALQEQAWAAVVPLVGKLKKFYEFSQRLGIHPPRAAFRDILLEVSCEARLLRDTLFKNASGQKQRGRQMSLFIKGLFKVASHTHDLHI